MTAEEFYARNKGRESLWREGALIRTGTVHGVYGHVIEVLVGSRLYLFSYPRDLAGLVSDPRIAVTPAVSNDRYPHTCAQCGGSCYIGYSTFEHAPGVTCG